MYSRRSSLLVPGGEINLFQIPVCFSAVIKRALFYGCHQSRFRSFQHRIPRRILLWMRSNPSDVKFLQSSKHMARPLPDGFVIFSGSSESRVAKTAAAEDAFEWSTEGADVA